MQNASKALEVKLAEKREEARKQDLKDAENLFKQVQAASDLRGPKARRRQACRDAETQGPGREMGKRSQELGGTERSRNNSSGSKTPTRGRPKS